MPKDSIMKLLVNIFILTLTWTSIQCSKQRDKLFFLQKSSGADNETLLVVTWMDGETEISAGCEIFNDKDLISEVLRYSDDSPIRTLSEDEMQNVLGDCTEFNLQRRRRETGNVRKPQENRDVRKESQADKRINEASTSSSEEDVESDEDVDAVVEAARRKPNTAQTTTEPTTTMGYDGWPVIFPGTKWCGAGDIAKNYDDLGLHQDTDRCCRAHDLCNDTLAPGETRNGLTNKSPFTKLSCKCDNDFYACLDRANSITSNTIGNMYFNILKRGCYQEDYPLTKKCKKYRTFLKLKCIEYERDTTAPKEIQWIPAKKYKKIPFPGPLTITLPF